MEVILAYLWFRANIIIWGIRKHYSTLDVRKILADADFENLARGEMRWEGDHLRVILTVNDSNVINKSSELSAKLRKIGCRCVLLHYGSKKLVHWVVSISRNGTERTAISRNGQVGSRNDYFNTRI